MNSKILLVDDDANLLSALRRRLGRRFSLTMALSAEEGLAALRSYGPFAVVVSDQHMSRMNGIEFLAEVKDLSPDTVCMMLTGNVSRRLAIDATFAAGACRVLTKPCSYEVLIDAIQSGVEEYWANSEEIPVPCHSEFGRRGVRVDL